MTLDQFANYAPVPGGINLYYSESVISAINISSEDCEGRNVASSLQELTSLTVTVEETSYILQVINSKAKDNYYNYVIDPIVLPSVQDTLCTDSQLVPNPGKGTFNISEYNATLNNYTDNTSTSYIYDVDRTQLSATPINYNAILNGTATPAEFQELNYSSVGIINSRYEGAKTTADEYGISPAFAGVLVEGAVYSPSQTAGFICSQSISDRTVEEIVVGYDAAASPSFDGSAQYTDSISINYTTLSKFFYNNGTISDSATSITVNTSLDIYPGDLIRFTQGTLLNEVMKVETVPLKTSNSTQFTVIRAYKSDIDPNNEARAFSNGFLTISRLTGTQLFKADSNKLYRLSNKKVWIKDNLKVFYVDEEGQVIFELVTCSV